LTEPSKPLLSICIPSYNRAALLSELLERIASDLTGGIEDLVEVVISDNASPDHTGEVVARLTPSIKHLVSIRQDENIGPDRNFLACVASANATFVWLMGDDDLPEPGSIARVLQVLADHPHIAGLTMDRIGRSFDLKTRRSEDALANFKQTTMLHGADVVVSHLTYYIAFISAQVFNRELWAKVVASRPVEEFFNGYIHMYVFANMLKCNPEWLVLKERLVTWRADNDSFMSSGRFRRMEIDVVGYEQIARACFGADSATYVHIRDLVATQNFRMHITAARMEGVWDAEMRRRTRQLAMRYYAKSIKFWAVTSPFLFLPNSILPVLRYAQMKVHRRRARRIGIAPSP
jgi:abequosyltransferase